MSRSYMFNDRNTGSQRRKREDQQVELRRQRTEELLNKKRVSSLNSEALATYETIRVQLESNNLEDIYQGAYDCRSKLSIENNPPIQSVIDSGMVPKFVQLLNPDFYKYFAPNSLINKARVEAAWVLTNISSGTTEQTANVVEAGAVPYLIEMLKENDDSIVDQAVWALGNIAGDNEATRDIILQQGALQFIIQAIEKYSSSKEHLKILRNLVWLISNLNRGRNPAPSIETMQQTLAVVENLIFLNDNDIVSDCIWCISYIVDAGAGLTNAVLQSKIMKRAYDLILNFTNSLIQQDYDPKISKIGAHSICPLIRMLGNIVTGTDEHTDQIISQGFLEFFKPIFYSYDNKKLPRIRKEMCWLISNISAGTSEQVKYILKSDLLGILIDSISRYELYIRKEAGFAICNILYFCSRNVEYLQPLLDKQIILALQSHMQAVTNVPEIQAQILDSVRYALEGGERIRAKFGENPVIQMLIDSKFVDEIEELQDSENNIVVQKAYNIIVDFFDGEDE